MRLRSAFLALTCVSWAFAQACGGDSGVEIDGSTDGTVNDVTPPPDGNNDVVNIPDTGTTDGGGDTGTTDGASDASDGGTTQKDSGIGSWTCGSVTVNDCSQCTGFTQPCAYCSSTDASVLKGVCTQLYTDCLNSIPQGYQDCPCTGGDASTCPEGYQVCINFGRCHTCTDNAQNTGLKCENGGTCAADAGCL